MKNFIPLLILTFFCFSCSRVGLIYDFAPKVMTDRLDDAFDFESDRYKVIKLQVKTNLTENKSDIVKSLTELIDEVLNVTATEPLYSTSIKKIIKDTHSKEKAIMGLFKPTFDKVILNLTEDEVREFQKFSSKKIKENNDLLKSLPDFVKKRTEGFRKTMGFFFDSSHEEQEALFEKFLLANFEFYKLQAEARSHLVEQFTWPMTDKQKVSDYALKYYSLDSSIRTLAYNQQLLVFENNLIQFQVEMWSLLKVKQKTYFKNKLQNFKTDLHQL